MVVSCGSLEYSVHLRCLTAPLEKWPRAGTSVLEPLSYGSDLFLGNLSNAESFWRCLSALENHVSRNASWRADNDETLASRRSMCQVLSFPRNDTFKYSPQVLRTGL